jgi:dephospho-CoA kinase
MIIGLTGGIATGKSVVSAQLEELGARVVDCDVIARFLGKYDPTLLAALRLAFGDSIFNSHGVLQRWALADIVFNDADKRLQLEGLLHPPVMAWAQANITAARLANQTLVVVVPLLFEGNFEELFDEVWVVTAELDRQIERLAQRSGLDRDRALKMIGAQMPASEKELRATRIIVNNGSFDQLRDSVRLLWEELGSRHDAS